MHTMTTPTSPAVLASSGLRLVLEYTEGDGCTYSCVNTYPVVYASAEALLVDLMEAAQAALVGRGSGEFLIAGRTLQASHFFAYQSEKEVRRNDGQLRFTKIGDNFFLPTPPDIYTVDEWFASC